jgi:hypothetical protein
MAVTVNGSTGVSLVQDNVIVLADLTATGTASSSTFLRGDNAWATPAGGGMTLLSTTAATGAATISVATNHTLYNQLMIVFKQVELSGTSGFIQVGVAGLTPMTINDVVSTASTTIIGLLTFDLNANQYWQEMQVAAVGPITTGNQFNGGSFQGMGQFQVDQNLRASSSANVSFSYSSGASFDGGSILIYGLS